MKVRLPVRRAILKRRTYEAPAEGSARQDSPGLQRKHHRLQRGGAKSTWPASAPSNGQLSGIRTRPRENLARYFRRATRKKSLLTNGGDDALRVFFDTFVEPRSHILICEPTFPMYRYYAEIAGAESRSLALRRRHGVSPRRTRSHALTQETSRLFSRQSQQPHRHAVSAKM